VTPGEAAIFVVLLAIFAVLLAHARRHWND
jgi:hypothetical protein